MAAITIFLACAECGAGLEVSSIGVCDADCFTNKIIPCKVCLDREETKARDEGYKEGYREGFDTGRAERGD